MTPEKLLWLDILISKLRLCLNRGLFYAKSEPISYEVEISCRSKGKTSSSEKKLNGIVEAKTDSISYLFYKYFITENFKSTVQREEQSLMTSQALIIQRLLTLVQSCCSYNAHLLSLIHLRIPYTELLRKTSNVCISFKLGVRSRGLIWFRSIYLMRQSLGYSVHSYSASRTVMSASLSAMLILIRI